MIITIKETRAVEHLNLIDPRSSINWINDLMGNHGALPYYDDDLDTYIMTQDDYKFWSDLTESYQSAIDRFYDLYNSLDNYSRKLLSRTAEDIAVDLEDYPTCLVNVCDEWDK